MTANLTIALVSFVVTFASLMLVIHGKRRRKEGVVIMDTVYASDQIITASNRIGGVLPFYEDTVLYLRPGDRLQLVFIPRNAIRVEK